VKGELKTIGIAVKVIYRYLCAGTSKMKVKLFIMGGIAAEIYIMNFIKVFPVCQSVQKVLDRSLN